MQDERDGAAPGSKRPWLRWLVAGLVVAAIAAPLAIWHEQIQVLFADRDRLAAAIRGYGAAGPLILMGLIVAQVVAAPIPGQAVNFVAGYLYGFWLGGLYSWLGSVLGSTLAIGLARVAGRPLVDRLVAPEALARLDNLARGQGLRFFFVIWLIPFLPDDLACFLAGLTLLPLPALIAVAAVGRIPGIIVSVWLGAYAERLTWQTWAIAGLAALAGLLVVWRCGDRLQAFVLGRTRRSTEEP